MFTKAPTLVGLVLASAMPCVVSAQSIPSVVVTVKNVQVSGGMNLTPVWIGMHDGSFDSYDGGQVASVPLGGNEIEALAEDGNNGPIVATFDQMTGGAPQVGGVAGPAGPLAPGDRASVTLNVDPTTDRYFSYASMIIPSNDFFIANGNPLAHSIFNGNGTFVGESFIVSGDETNDAGTEANDEIAGNVAFLAQAGPNTGTTENLPVTTPVPGFAAPGSLAFPNGVLNHPVFRNGGAIAGADTRILEVSFRYIDLGGNARFEGVLSPDQEIQADPVSSDGSGVVRVASANGTIAILRARYNNLTGPLTAAHLHLGQAGTNGSVVVDLAAGISGTNSVVAVIQQSDLTGPLAGAAFIEFLNELAAGNVYLNLHTAQFPAGELRGQLDF